MSRVSSGSEMYQPTEGPLQQLLQSYTSEITSDKISYTAALLHALSIVNALKKIHERRGTNRCACKIYYFSIGYF